MGFGIIRGQKFKIGGLKGMEIHILRSRPSKSNPDIDLSKTKDNYTIIGSPENLNEKVAKRVAELPGQKTKTGKIRKLQNNAVMLYDFIITASHEDMEKWDKEVVEQYFKDSVDFIKKHYGEQNIMYAQVHLDERTPHLHLGLVPEYKGKLAAYKLFVPDSMRKLQDDFYAEVSSRYGLERGEVESKTRHKSTVDLKIATIEEVKREKENLAKVKAEIADAELRRVEMLQILEDLQQETEKKQKEYEDNKFLADNEERRFLQAWEEQSIFLENVKKANKTIKLAEIKETEYNVTNFLLKESEKDLKKNNKKLEEMIEEKNKIYAEIDDKLTEPIKRVLSAWDNKKELNSAFVNFVQVAKEVLQKLDLFVQNYKKPNINYENFDIKKNFSRGR